MAVFLSQSSDIPAEFDRWAATPGVSVGHLLNPAHQALNLGGALEVAFDAVAGEWLALGRELGADKSAALAHAPSCAANVSDMGLMLAWSRLVSDWAHERGSLTLVICDDPWLFRHLRGLAHVSSGPAPSLWRPSLILWMRGYAARALAGLRLARAALSLRFQRRQATKGEPVLMVYGHPRSNTEGYDGYFGELMQRFPALKRILHVDCPLDRVKELSQDRRSLSLHGFGCPGGALLTPFFKWRPSAKYLRGPDGWLVRRAAAHEGATGQAAMLAWQNHCHLKWLKRAQPSVVAWPWENHTWERAFVRRAKALGIRTVGYQHSVVGRQMLNYGLGSNCDGVDSLPDQILTSGAATLARLESMDVPSGLLKVGGALRFVDPQKVDYDPMAPVFVALPFDGLICKQMLEACHGVKNHHFIVKDHPMSPFMFHETDNVTRTEQPMGAQGALSAVLFAATTVGQEAALAGLPILRFQPTDRIAMDILPDGLKAMTVGIASLQDALDQPSLPGALPPDYLFAPVDWALWQKELGLGT